jgi:CubicO group peptidase (beta-lactamase class C family)
MKLLPWCAPVVASLVVIAALPHGSAEALHYTKAGAEPQPMPRATPASVGLSPVLLTEATDLLRRFVAEKKIAGAVAAGARKGEVAYLAPVGVQDLETRAPMTERSLFRIYSMTKPVTAVAVMMLDGGPATSTSRSTPASTGGTVPRGRSSRSTRGAT